MTIWKYKLEVKGIQEIAMPKGATILSVAKQDNDICLWAMVHPSNELETRCIELITTGGIIQNPTAHNRRFIGTVVKGPFVCHLFELTSYIKW